MGNKIFISHATPDDNDFTKWLSLKLISLGYEVWCDILFLDKGTDFWKVIEREIREHTFKFLFIASVASNQREGVLKELAVAEKVKKQIKDDSFIIPLVIDGNLSFDDINIDIVRLNAIDFKESWALGLQSLLEALEKQMVPKSIPDPVISNLIYQQIYLHNKGVVEKEEIYDSNWFSIESFPEYLRFHDFEKLLPKHFKIKDLSFPVIKYKHYLCTFAWEYDFIEQIPQSYTYDCNNTIKIPTKDIISENIKIDFIDKSVCQRLIIQLINIAFEIKLKEKGLRSYQMSNTVGYFFEKGSLEKDKFSKTQLVGKQKDKIWHYGISGAGKLYPFPVLMLISHIFFTEDGVNIINSKNTQHSARRKQGKNWWNDDWRNKLLAFAKYLSDDENSINLEVGSQEIICVSNEPIKFKGKISYNIPEKNTLKEEAELRNIYDYDEEIIESSEIE